VRIRPDDCLVATRPDLVRLSTVVARGLLELDLSRVQETVQVGPDLVRAHVADHNEVVGALRPLLDGGQDLSLMPLPAGEFTIADCAGRPFAHDGSPPSFAVLSAGATGTNESQTIGLQSARRSQYGAFRHFIRSPLDRKVRGPAPRYRANKAESTPEIRPVFLIAAEGLSSVCGKHTHDSGRRWVRRHPPGPLCPYHISQILYVFSRSWKMNEAFCSNSLLLFGFISYTS